MGVVSAVELRSCSLVTGEKCSGGGVSESSFTAEQGDRGDQVVSSNSMLAVSG